MSERRPRPTLSIQGDRAAPGTAAYIAGLMEGLDKALNSFDVTWLNGRMGAKLIETSSGMLAVTHLTERPWDKGLADGAPLPGHVLPSHIFGDSVDAATELGVPILVTQAVPGIDHLEVVGEEPNPKEMAALLEAYSLTPQGV